jgi:ribosomal 30S subunit maturation factor RimM
LVKGKILKLKKSEFYLNDLIGLRTLIEENKTLFMEVPG